MSMRSLSQTAWVAAGIKALAHGGIDAVRVEPLAAQLGVTKGSFYHHFASRRALHLAMLEAWEQVGTTAIIDEIDAESLEPVDRLRRLAHRSVLGDPEGDAIENGIRAWAAADEFAAAATARVDGRRLAYAQGLLRDAGLSSAVARRRARLFYRVLIGEFTWRSSGGPAMTRAEIDDAIDLLVT